jgi:uncharacterized protein YjbJ (UPF0337 family)
MFISPSAPKHQRNAKTHFFVPRKLETDEGQGQRKVGNLTDDDLDKIAGRRDQLEGKIQERYGIAKDQAKKDIDTWYNAQTW